MLKLLYTVKGNVKVILISVLASLSLGSYWVITWNGVWCYDSVSYSSLLSQLLSHVFSLSRTISVICNWSPHFCICLALCNIWLWKCHLSFPLVVNALSLHLGCWVWNQTWVGKEVVTVKCTWIGYTQGVWIGHLKYRTLCLPSDAMNFTDVKHSIPPSQQFITCYLTFLT